MGLILGPVLGGNLASRSNKPASGVLGGPSGVGRGPPGEPRSRVGSVLGSLLEPILASRSCQIGTRTMSI